METSDLERYRRLTVQYPSFVGLTYLPMALIFAGLAFFNLHASTPLEFFGFWVVALPAIILLWWAIRRWYRQRFGRVRPRPEQARRNRRVTTACVLFVLALALSAGYVPWDDYLGIYLTHLLWAGILFAVWWTGDFARDRLHLPFGALALVILAFVDHSLFAIGPYDLVPDTTEGPGLVDAVALAAVGYLDHRWLVGRMESLGTEDFGGSRSEAELPR